jgi:hypothetical protein
MSGPNFSFSRTQSADQTPFDGSSASPPFTSTNAQDAIIEARSAGSDFLAGYEHILSSETVTIPQRKQMIVHGFLFLQGLLVINGAQVMIGQK